MHDEGAVLDMMGILFKHHIPKCFFLFNFQVEEDLFENVIWKKTCRFLVH